METREPQANAMVKGKSEIGKEGGIELFFDKEEGPRS